MLIVVAYLQTVEQVHLRQNVLPVLGQNVAAGQFLLPVANSRISRRLYRSREASHRSGTALINSSRNHVTLSAFHDLLVCKAQHSLHRRTLLTRRFTFISVHFHQLQCFENVHGRTKTLLDACVATPVTTFTNVCTPLQYSLDDI